MQTSKLDPNRSKVIGICYTAYNSVPIICNIFLDLCQDLEMQDKRDAGKEGYRTGGV